MDILIQAARVGADAAALRRAAEAVTDWEAVKGQAARHGLLPLLYSRLRQHCPDAIPAAVAEDLRKAYLANAARNMMMTAELKAVMGWLEAEDVPAIAYKGPTLAAWAYGDIALREFCDLDILVRPSDKTRAIAVLIANGCVPKGAPGAADLSGNCEIGLATPAGCDRGPALGRLTALLAIGRHRCGADACPPGGHGRRRAARRSAPTTCLRVSLCTERGTAGRRSAWICDVANLVRVAPIGWDALLADRRTRRIFHVALLLAADLLSAPVPPEVIAKARRDTVAVNVARQIEHNLFTEDGDIAGRPAGAMMQLRMAGTLRDKARYVWRRALEANQTDNDFLPLPPRLKPMLHVVRPFRVLGKIISRGGLRPRLRRASGAALRPALHHMPINIPFSARVSVPDGVLARNLEGESVVLNLKTEKYFGLDEVGTRMWTLLTDAGNIQSAYDSLAAEYRRRAGTVARRHGEADRRTGGARAADGE